MKDLEAGALQIGSRLRKIRQSKSMTLEQASAATGVSKPMISQIERGQSVPTVTVLWNIATGLKVPFSSFLEEPERKMQVIAREENPHLLEENGAMRVWSQFPYDPVRSMEIFRIELDPGCRHVSAAHESGVEEYILVEKGHFVMEVQGERCALQEGEALRFRADCPHAYFNPGSALCRVTNMIFYPGTF